MPEPLTPAERLRSALGGVLADWSHALEPLPTPSTGKAPGPAGSRPPLPTSSLSVRAELFEFLASWRRYTTDWFHDHPTSWEVPHLAAWFLTHVDRLAGDPVIVDELDRPSSGLSALAKELHDAANPPVPQGPALGECPVCHDTIRWVPLRAVACCGGCGVCRPWAEWKGVLGVNGLVTEKLAVLLLASEGRKLSAATVRKWAERGKVQRHEVGGRVLYDAEEVIRAASEDRRHRAA